MRKPRTVWFGGGWAECIDDWYSPAVELGLMPWLTAPQCRRLAAWLLKAAEWIEEKEGGR